MARPGRKALTTPNTPWKCQIPEDVAAKVDLLILDPVKGVPTYGARSALVTDLMSFLFVNFVL